MDNSNRLVSSRKYNKWATYLLLFDIVFIFIILLLAPGIHLGEGNATREECNSAMLTLLLGFILPAGGVVFVNLSPTRWRDLARQKVLRWQGAVAAGVIALVSIGMFFYLLYIIVWADYQKTEVDAQGLESVSTPCCMALGARVQTLCTYVIPLLTTALALEVFNVPSNSAGNDRVANPN